MKNPKTLIILIFLAAAFIRLADAFRPINQASWRESDLGSVARNYVQEGMNFFYPRIDWRGQTEGFAEMEFPLYPWLIAITYKIFGIHDFFGRLWAFGFSLGTLLFFFKLAREYLDEFGQIFALSFFAFNPMIVEFSTAIQPEGLMIFLYIASVYFFTQWLKKDNSKYFWLAANATAFAILAKASSAHIGLFFGILLLHKYGRGAFRQGKIWLFATVTLLPAIVWYLHARGLWRSYGNSLGVSNEYHWVGWDFFTNSYFIKGILYSDLLYVWIIFGAFIGGFAIWQGFGDKTVKHVLLWFASIFTMYVIASRTTADEWAHYYHIFSVPPAALLFGFGVQKFRSYLSRGIEQFTQHTRVQNFTRVVVSVFFSFTVLFTFLLEAKQVRAWYLDHRVTDESLACVQKLKPMLQSEGLILVSGSNCFDPDGYAVAYNASFMFYWLERKGFNICIEDQSLERVRQHEAAGAKYFVAQKSYMDMKDGFENQLRLNFPIVAECDGFVTFDLTIDK